MRYYSSTAGTAILTSSCSDTATSIDLSSTAGLPFQFPFTLVLDVGTVSEEIVTVTALSGLSATVIRGEDGSGGQVHQTGAVVRHMASARDFREPQQHIEATSAHGTTSAVVGVDDAQTLKNKTLDPSTLVVVDGDPVLLSEAVGSGAGVVAFSVPGGLGTSVGAGRIYNDSGKELTIEKVRASVGTPPSGSAVIVDVNLGGTTIFTTQSARPSVAAGGFTAVGIPAVTAWPDGAYLTVDVDQVGSSSAGADLVVQVRAS